MRVLVPTWAQSFTPKPLTALTYTAIAPAAPALLTACLEAATVDHPFAPGDTVTDSLGNVWETELLTKGIRYTLGNTVVNFAVPATDKQLRFFAGEPQFTEEVVVDNSWKAEPFDNGVSYTPSQAYVPHYGHCYYDSSDDGGRYGGGYADYTVWK